MKLSDEYATVSQAASYLDVTRQTVWRWIKAGNLPSEKIGNQILVKISGIFEHEDNLVAAAIMRRILFLARLYLRHPSRGYKETEGDILEFQDISDDNIYQFIIHKKNGKTKRVNIKFVITLKPSGVGYSLGLTHKGIWFPEDDTRIISEEKRNARD